jgi:hypothetical protein
VISEKKSRKKIDFFLIEKRHSKKEKSQFLLDILNQNFVLFQKKKISSLAHREVPQICVGSAARKTLAAHCTYRILAPRYKYIADIEDFGQLMPAS